MKKLIVCFGLLGLIGAGAANAAEMASRSVTRTKAATVSKEQPTLDTDITKQMNDFQTRLTALEIEVANQKKTIATMQSTASAVAAPVSTVTTPVTTTPAAPVVTTAQAAPTVAGIVGAPRPAVKGDIGDIAAECHAVTTKLKCNSSYFRGMMGREAIPGLGMTVSAKNNASAEAACSAGCGAEMLVGYKNKLKVGVSAQTSRCIVLPFYDVDNDYSLRCAIFDFDNKTAGTGSTCAWDDNGGGCLTADIVCSKDGYCSATKR